MTGERPSDQPRTPALTDGPPAPRRPAQPHLSGDLPTMLDSGPAFATAMRGYDRLQVDNYVAWAETELRAAQRVAAELVARLGASEGELRNLRRLVAQSGQDRDLVRFSDRVADLLRLAVQEAAASAAATEADAAEAEDVVANAREEAEVTIRRARRLEAQAAARLQTANRRLTEARTAEEQTRSRIQAMLQEAAEEQERLEEDAAARITRRQRELQDLRRREHGARQVLAQLIARVDAALVALADEPPTEFSFSANTAGPPNGFRPESRTAPHRHTGRHALDS